MSTADTYVRARIDTETKQRATDALSAMGLSISDAIRLLMLRLADEKRLPFDVKVPSATTRKAITELESGRGKRFVSVDDLMKDLNAGDALTALGRKIGLTNEDFAAFEQDRDKAPAEPVRFE